MKFLRGLGYFVGAAWVVVFLYTAIPRVKVVSSPNENFKITVRKERRLFSAIGDSGSASGNHIVETKDGKVLDKSSWEPYSGYVPLHYFFPEKIWLSGRLLGLEGQKFEAMEIYEFETILGDTSQGVSGVVRNVVESRVLPNPYLLNKARELLQAPETHSKEMSMAIALALDFETHKEKLLPLFESFLGQRHEIGDREFAYLIQQILEKLALAMTGEKLKALVTNVFLNATDGRMIRAGLEFVSESKHYSEKEKIKLFSKHFLSEDPSISDYSVWRLIDLKAATDKTFPILLAKLRSFKSNSDYWRSEHPESILSILLHIGGFQHPDVRSAFSFALNHTDPAFHLAALALLGHLSRFKPNDAAYIPDLEKLKSRSSDNRQLQEQIDTAIQLIRKNAGHGQ
jgi:hypothetical protein